MFVGQVGRDMREREAFQELDYRAVFGSMTKWATEIDDPARVPEIVSRAFYTATNGRPGPVVVAIPEDMLVERVAVPTRRRLRCRDFARPNRDGEVRRDAGEARAPIMLLGGSRWSQAASDSVGRFAEKYSLPIATTFRRGSLSINCILATPATSVLGQIRSCSIASSRPISWSWSAGGSANCRRRATRCSIFRARRCRSSMFIRAPKSLAGFTVRILRSMRRRPRLPRLSIVRRWKRRRAAMRRSRTPTSRLDRKTDRAARRRQFRCGHGVAARKPAPRRYSLQRRRQLCVMDASLLPFPPLRQPGCADLGLDGLWGAGGDGDEAAISRPAGDMPRRRRRLPDERPGIRHRRAI